METKFEYLFDVLSPDGYKDIFRVLCRLTKEYSGFFVGSHYEEVHCYLLKYDLLQETLNKKNHFRVLAGSNQPVICIRRGRMFTVVSFNSTYEPTKQTLDLFAKTAKTSIEKMLLRAEVIDQAIRAKIAEWNKEGRKRFEDRAWVVAMSIINIDRTLDGYLVKRINK